MAARRHREARQVGAVQSDVRPSASRRRVGRLDQRVFAKNANIFCIGTCREAILRE